MKALIQDVKDNKPYHTLLFTGRSKDLELVDNTLIYRFFTDGYDRGCQIKFTKKEHFLLLLTTIDQYLDEKYK